MALAHHRLPSMNGRADRQQTSYRRTKSEEIRNDNSLLRAVRSCMGFLVLAAAVVPGLDLEGDAPVASPATIPDPRWILGEGMTTVWRVDTDTRLPHGDFIEQGGLRCGQVVEYQVDEQRQVHVKRGVVWPGLRIIPNDTTGSLIRRHGEESEPSVQVDGMPLPPIVVDQVVLDGTWTVQGRAGADLAVTRCTFPSPERRCALDRWTLRNRGTSPRTVTVSALSLRGDVPGPYGTNHCEVTCTAPPSTTLQPGQELSFAVLFRAWLDGESADTVDAVAEEADRRSHVAALQGDLRLETPVPEFDRAFAFCKLRVAEAINATRGGMMLAPGGLTYYAAVWCNDNVEYAGPFFPFLGDANANQASLDTYRLYRRFMKSDHGKIPSSIIAEGVDTWSGAGDRGDAAMYAYGCSRFCLARGNSSIARELWPAIVWCLDYNRRQSTPQGVIASDTDELEGRLPTGRANLSTSALHYGGLRSAADLGRALGHAPEARDFDRQADALAQAMESYFGATIEGFATYRYYNTNTTLRSWICLPLCMGLRERRTGTIAALFSPRLWTADGLATQAGEKTYWDRSTLYGFRGVLQAGESVTSLRYLKNYTRRRLLGEHVPYPVEVGPEGGQQHLSSESALYCRIFTEGLFGILPTGLDRFRCTPRLPAEWPRMALRSIRAFDRTWDLVVERQDGRMRVMVEQGGKRVFDRTIEPDATVEIILP